MPGGERFWREKIDFHERFVTLRRTGTNRGFLRFHTVAQAHPFSKDWSTRRASRKDAL
jgi:hypothetical protein